MMDWKAMTTLMASNLKLLSDASSEAVDATMYHKMIWSLMYLMNMRPDIFFVVNTLSQFLIDPSVGLKLGRPRFLLCTNKTPSSLSLSATDHRTV